MSRDINWVKNEIKCAEKLFDKIKKDIQPGEELSFLSNLPEPWTFLDNAESWKPRWKKYVNDSVDSLDTKYPGDKQKFLDYNHAMELFKHNPKDYPFPTKPTYNDGFKKELKIIRTFFDCREMRYMQMLCTIHDVIVHEFPHLLEDEEVPVATAEEPKIKSI